MPCDGSTRRRIVAIVRHETALLARSPGPMIGYTVMPLLLMTVLRPMLERLVRADPMDQFGGTGQAAAGMAVMFSLFALKLVGADFLQERTWHTWDRLRASPARSGEILVGKLLPIFGMLIVQQAVVIGFAVLALGLRPATWSILVLVAIAWSGCVLVLGTAAATLVRSPAQLSVSGDIAAVLTSILAGALVPAPLLPTWLRVIGPLSPGYWAMRCYGAVLAGSSQSSLIPSAAGLAFFFALGVVLSVWLPRRWSDT